VERDREIAAVRERLERLESEKTELQANLKRLLSAQEAGDISSFKLSVASPALGSIAGRPSCIVVNY
jgi:hypothetical protein